MELVTEHLGRLRLGRPRVTRDLVLSGDAPGYGSFFARLGCTRIGSPGILGYSGG